jgi:RNA polymerase sigma factor (sigma-70 family)
MVSPLSEQGHLPSSREIPKLAEHLFRQESGKLVSILIRIFGVDHLQLAEDVVQEALVRALQTWPYYGIPKNPAAWLMQTAKHLALDLVRREKLFRDKLPQITGSLELSLKESNAENTPQFSEEIRDGRLRLIFTCCHPAIPGEAQSALALKTLCGFSPAEIASAFLTSEAAITKRLTRARRRIRELQVPFEIPAGEELSARLDGVLQTLYLLFNEGYKASSGDTLVRVELCLEAIRLGVLLAEHPVVGQPRTHALVALMLLNSARLSSRTSPEGDLLLLKEQDRAHWDREMIRRGLAQLNQAASGDELSEYHLQAGIAACHCLAPGYQSTDWQKILSLYDCWMKINESPVVALNRAIAVANLKGPQAGLKAISEIRHRKHLESYYLLYAVWAEFEAQLGNFGSAAEHLRKSLSLTDLKSERAFLSKKVKYCEGRVRHARSSK